MTFEGPASTLTNFPLYVRSSGGSASSVAAHATTGAGVVFDVAGSPLTQCRIAYDAGTGVGQWALGPVTLTTAGLTVRMSYGALGSESDESDCSTTTGPYQDYALAWFAGSTTDWSGNSHTATLSGSPAAGTGPTGPSLVLDGVNDVAVFAATGVGGELDSAQVTLTALVKGDLPTSNTAAATFLLDRASASPRCWWTATSTTNGTCDWNVSIGERVRYGPVDADTWALVTVGADDLVRYGFLSGALVESPTRSANPASPPTSNLRLGANYLSTGNFFAGQVEMLLWRLDTVALSTDWQAYETAMYRDGTAATFGAEGPFTQVIFFHFSYVSEPPPSGGESAADPTPLSICDGLLGAHPVQVGDLVDCYGGDRELLAR
ncbi:MAG: hypothetical protein GC160_19870 [Acidobacteria bacterium]|nr:hypothetical protein [Acidobacteriota bacterium]